MTNTIFALIDCDNFFVSCERLFRPDLEGRPVIVLSSNDGCVVSRSREAKELDIPMGAPAFKYRQMFKEQGVVQFSANFELYGDISERITKVLTSITPRTEVYSVDESFLDLSELDITDYQLWGRFIRTRIWKEVGMPVSMGIAATKTLSKLASERAKRSRAMVGLLDLYSLTAEERARHLLDTPVQDVWGIGRKLAPRLRAEGVYNALDLAQMRPKHAQQLMGVHGRQLVTELQGTACHQLEAFGRIRQTVMKGRMFGEDTKDLSVIEAAVASLTARATYCLRKEHLCASTASLSLSTNRHKPGYHRKDIVISLNTPTADTGTITTQLVRAAATTLRPGVEYHRANVMLYDLVNQRDLQIDILGTVDPVAHARDQARMSALDSLNVRYGNNTVRFAAEDLSRAWEPKHRLRSPRYTTNWQELPIARILRR